MIAEAKKDGVDVSFGEDGSMTVVDPEDGSTVVQKPDGTWTIKSEDGTEGQYGGNWPENEFTRLLPKPEFELLAAAATEEEFSVAFLEIPLDQIKDYVEKVKAKGFTENVELVEEEVMGMSIYTYKAENKDGYIVTVSCAMGACGILLEKP